MGFEMARERNLVMINKDNRAGFCFGTIGLIVAPGNWKLEFLEALLLGQIFVLRKSNFRGATISQ